MKFIPLQDKVLIQRTEAEATTESGIILTQTLQDKLPTGRVIAVGPGRVQDGDLRPVSVSVGETVMFAAHAGAEVQVGADKYLVLSEPEIFGILEV
jgi:chaperonin GroES|tara:strand:- start:3742 stop:4029 length:288 start_codon:yes stop_codon:yes gene_type:complete